MLDGIEDHGGLIERIASAGREREAALSAERRRRRGVVHTPPEVARFVVNRVEAALGHLGVAGVADPRVHLLDPACGPGIFLAAVLERAVGQRRPAKVAARRLLTPAARASGWDLSLRVADSIATETPFDARPADEDVIVILGNPPWAGRSANRGGASDTLLADFRVDASGTPLRERKLGVLSDDYVRFLRWGAEVVRRHPGGGVLAMVTNASYLDGPVHRGMRGALSRWFSTIEIVDLGGSALVAAADGPRDENVFGVRPAVAIAVMVAEPGDRAGSRVGYAALRGAARSKLRDLGSPPATVALRPTAPGFVFRPIGAVDARYARWPSLADAMPFHREGVQTNRDRAVVDADRTVLLRRLRAFVAGERTPDLEPAYRPSRHYDPDRARREVASALERDPGGRGFVFPIAYRPFDRRWFAALPRFCHRPRRELIRAVGHGGLSLVTVRKDRGRRRWSHFGVSDAIVDNCFLSTRSSCRARAFPTHGPDGQPNLGRGIVDALAGIGVEASAAVLVAYALAVLAAPSYQERFDAALRLDYPRLPLPAEREGFEALVRAGRRVAAALACGPGDPDEPQVDVGHFAVRSATLAAAVEEADRNVVELL